MGIIYTLYVHSLNFVVVGIDDLIERDPFHVKVMTPHASLAPAPPVGCPHESGSAWMTMALPATSRVPPSPSVMWSSTLLTMVFNEASVMMFPKSPACRVESEGRPWLF